MVAIVAATSSAQGYNDNGDLVSYNTSTPTTPVVVPSSVYIFGDSQTSGRAGGATNSPADVLSLIWSASSLTPSVTINDYGVGGRSLAGTASSFDSVSPANPSWIHFQESGNQAHTGQTTPAEFGTTFETFVTNIDTTLSNANTVISTETAFSFGREGSANRNWDAYNTQLLNSVATLASSGITVYVANVDANIKALGVHSDVTGAGDVWFQNGEANAYHYTSLGNLMVALSMLDALRYDVDSLDLSTVPNEGNITSLRKTACLDIIKGRV